jgi:UDP-N-acetylmuramoylalanine--D-glutamate ligase
MMEIKDKQAVVVGLADSGVGAAEFLARQGARVIATDRKSAAELGPALQRLRAAKVEFALGGHPDEIFARADLIVTSPGVPKDSPFFLAAQARGVPVWSELELAARAVNAEVLAVTGTNGKSTVVTLLGEIIKAARGAERVFVGGNLGTPLIELALSGGQAAAAVVEVSSFQLEFVETFHPRVAVMLNITDDHLDRYRDFAQYADYKWRIFANMTADDYAVVNLDDPVVERMAAGLKPRVLTISLTRASAWGMVRRGDALEYRAPGGSVESLAVADVPLHGAHNLINVMAAACAARAVGVSMETVAAAVRGFSGLSHRLQLVRELRGVRYFDDSKATNAGAVEAAVLGLEGPVVLLMGGQAKGCSFVELGPRLKGRVKHVAAFGECRRQLAAELGPSIRVSVHETMDEALAAAAGLATAGDAVLLAPACASFDQFKNYKHRGDVFRALVLELR